MTNRTDHYEQLLSAAFRDDGHAVVTHEGATYAIVVTKGEDGEIVRTPINISQIARDIDARLP
jgi:hypothetical protein